MSIQLRASGPSYSTDAAAGAVSGFLAQRSQLPSYEEREPATTPARPLTELYPKLYADRGVPVYWSDLLGVLHRVAAFFGQHRPALALLPLALAAAIGSNPAGAAVQLFAEGVGSGMTAVESYNRALDQAQGELDGSCGFAVINKRINKVTNGRDGTVFVTRVEISAICA